MRYMIKIELEKNEYNYLINSSFLSLNWKILMNNANRIDDCYIIRVTLDQADQLRDLFGEQLQLVGFDEHYAPTKEGEILESLIDKFFCG